MMSAFILWSKIYICKWSSYNMYYEASMVLIELFDIDAFNDNPMLIDLYRHCIIPDCQVPASIYV